MVGTHDRIMIVLTPAFVPAAGGVQMLNSKMARWVSYICPQLWILLVAETEFDKIDCKENHASNPGGLHRQSPCGDSVLGLVG